ncbi:MAG TPA: pyrroloquinoline quinone biosynthesis protein PqqB [Pararhizobium sp.]|nr:pyrroloquinoline quinone biosynthesis protein PqqB [Pararhizobium sp.]
MRIIILGAAAGGGFPQWNCGCSNCVAAREGRGGFLPRTQSSVAVSGGDGAWALLDASPDIRAQINACRELHPTGPRSSPLSSVVLTGGDLDHIAGLLTLREKQAFRLFLTREIATILSENPVFRALDRDYVKASVVALEEAFEPVPGVAARLFAVPGKVPLYAEEGEVVTDLEGEQTVGVELIQGDRRAYYIPGCARITEALAARLDGAALVLFDGTFFRDDEMQIAGVGEKTAARMGHMPIGGTIGSLAAFKKIRADRRMFIHINNTNPVLDPASPEHGAVVDAGWEIAEDQMEVGW